MNSQTAIATVLFMLAAFLGYQVISRLLCIRRSCRRPMPFRAFRWWARWWRQARSTARSAPSWDFLAVMCATTNVVGGFIITDRMLRMFKKKPTATPKEEKANVSACATTSSRPVTLASILFILGLRGLSHPETARRGMHLAEFGMLMAIIGTLLHQEIVSYEWIIAGSPLRSALGTMIGLWVPMTAMPQRTAFSHAFGAFAAALVGISEYFAWGESQ